MSGWVGGRTVDRDDNFDCLSHGYVDVVKRAMRTNKAELAPA